MVVKIGHSVKNELGTYKGGEKGDQNGREVLIANWYLHKKGWVVIRAKDSAVAEKIAEAMEMVCANDNFGYCQEHRLSGFNEAAKYNYNPSKVKVKCELDCSETVRLCIHYAGIKCDNFRTKTQIETLKKTGAFEFLTSDKYCKSSDYLRRGDILLTAETPGHTVVVLTNGEKEEKTMAILDKVKTVISNIRNFGAKRSTGNIKYIVIHYTANDGDTDEANAKYFKNNVVKASAHYFVDSNSITQSVKDDYVAWSVGGSKYANCSTTGGGKYHGKCTNSNSISIELCDDRKNGTIYPSDATIENALQLTRELMKKYNIPKERVIRHFDVTGKICPAYWCGTATKNKKWLTEFWNRIDETSGKKPEAIVVKKGYLELGDNGSDVKEMQKMLIACGFSCGSAGADGDFGQGTLKAVKNFQKAYKLTVDGFAGKATMAKLKEVYKKKTEVKVDKVEAAKYFDKKYSSKYKTTSDLNLRCGAGTSKKKILTIPKGKEVTCYGYYSKALGQVWLLVQYGNHKGFCSFSYLKK